MYKYIFLILLLGIYQPMEAFEEGYADNDGIKIYYRDYGPVDAVPIILVQGLGGQLTQWPDNLIDLLIDNDFRPIVYDNRDIGLSTKFIGSPNYSTDYLKYILRLPLKSEYTIDDMGQDGISVLDELNIDSAHLLGMSMGGMIAQQLAAKHPDRVRTLTSVMSTTFAKHLPPPTQTAETALTDLASGETSESRAEAIRKRGFYPESMPRQMMAIFKTGDRSNEVKTMDVDTLVIHGADDGLIPPAHGEHTAELIRGSELVLFPGMGHNIPKDVLPKMLGYMIDHMKTADYGKGTLNPALD